MGGEVEGRFPEIREDVAFVAFSSDLGWEVECLWEGKPFRSIAL